MNSHTVKIIAVTEPVLLARVTVLLRKYDVTIDRCERVYLENGQEEMTLVLRPMRDNLAVAMKKLERLVPIIHIQ